MILQYHYLAIYWHVPHDFLLYRNKNEISNTKSILKKKNSKYIFFLFMIFVSFEYGLKVSYSVYINGPAMSQPQVTVDITCINKEVKGDVLQQ